MAQTRNPGYSTMFSNRMGDSACAANAPMSMMLTGLPTRMTMSRLVSRYEHSSRSSGIPAGGAASVIIADGRELIYLTYPFGIMAWGNVYGNRGLIDNR